MGFLSKIVSYVTTTGPRGGKKFINSKGHEEYGTPSKAAPKAAKPKATKPAKTKGESAPKPPPRAAKPNPDRKLSKPATPPVAAAPSPGPKPAAAGVKPGQEDHGQSAQALIPLHRGGLTNVVHHSGILGRVETDYTQHVAMHIKTVEDAVTLMGIGKLMHNRDLPCIVRLLEKPHDGLAFGRQLAQYNGKDEYKDPHPTYSSETRIYVPYIEQRQLRLSEEARAEGRTRPPSNLSSGEYSVPPAGGHSPHDHVHTIVIHEMGHYLDHYGLEKTGPIREATIALRGIARARGIATLGNQEGKRPSDETPNQASILAVSKYAKMNIAEFVAEAHAAYVLHGPEMKKVDPEAHAAVRRIREEMGIE